MRRVAANNPLHIAQHEAAHVVVGVSVGLRLCKAVIEKTDLGNGWERLGWVWFDTRSPKTARALMFAAGVAWDRAVGVQLYGGGDLKYLRELVTARDVGPCERAAGAILAGLGPVHARVTRALLERELSGLDVLAIARGERLSDD